MRTQELYEMILALNEAEKDFLHVEKPTIPVTHYAVYKKFLSQKWIAQHNLAEIYWPQVEGKVNIKTPNRITEMPLLDEDILLFSGINFQISKQINWPSGLFRSNNYLECFYVMEGKASVSCCNKDFHLNCGDFFFLPPYVEYALDTDPDCIGIHIVIRRNYIARQYPILFPHDPLLKKFFEETVVRRTNGDYFLIHTGEQEELKELSLHLLSEYLYETNYKEDTVRAYLVLLFNKLMKYGRDHVETTIAISKFEIYYQRILEYLSQNFRTATLESTAQAIFFSKQYLCKIIRTVSGKSFSNLLAEVRIEKVKQLISENSYLLRSSVDFLMQPT